jgi:purine-nucleoside phosphorylase
MVLSTKIWKKRVTALNGIPKSPENRFCFISKENMMENILTITQIDEAARSVAQRTTHKPEIAIILGSGLGDLAEKVEQPDDIPYSRIPNMPVSTVPGHQGKFVVGKLQGKNVLCMQGRIHYYEGYNMSQVTFPVRVMQRMGIKTLIVTNAAGALNPQFDPGDLMLITDHISLVGMTGLNPLRGANMDEFGVRFPDMSQVYDRHLMEIARQAALANKIRLREGVYICLSGPSFETPADLRFLRTIGADAVGMSTVPEVIVARHGGMRVLGFSGISNKAPLDGSLPTTHTEVIEAGKLLGPRLENIILHILNNI